MAKTSKVCIYCGKGEVAVLCPVYSWAGALAVRRNRAVVPQGLCAAWNSGTTDYMIERMLQTGRVPYEAVCEECHRRSEAVPAGGDCDEVGVCLGELLTALASLGLWLPCTDEDIRAAYRREQRKPGPNVPELSAGYKRARAFFAERRRGAEAA
jgi:hypothetical protein